MGRRTTIWLRCWQLRQWIKKLRWPLVWRKSLLTQRDSHAEETSRLRREYSSKQQDTKAMVDEVLANLIQIDAVKDWRAQNYRCAVTFSTQMVRDSLHWGNSQDSIHYLAERVGMLVEREMQHMNWSRLGREAEDRERHEKYGDPVQYGGG